MKRTLVVFANLALNTICTLALVVLVSGCDGSSASTGSDVPSSGLSLDTGRFTDSRDGTSYKWAKVGGQTWMAQNLNYRVGNSLCYDGSAVNCSVYGRLYDWPTAANLTDTCFGTSCATSAASSLQGICPSGWRVPTFEEWWNLCQYSISIDSINAVSLLSASISWNVVGRDAFGFAVLAGGLHDADHGFSGRGLEADFWAVTQGGEGTSRIEFGEVFNPGGDTAEPVNHILVKSSETRQAYSLRCIKK